MTSLSDWLTAFKRARSFSGSQPKIHKTQLTDIVGIVEISRSPKDNMLTATYRLHHDEFDRIVFGKRVCGGIISLSCGFYRPPYNAVYSYGKDDEEFKKFLETIESEAPAFFRDLPTLSGILAELTSSHPRFPQVQPHPQARQLREMHSAVVAYLLNLEWRERIDRALAQGAGPSIAWVREVAARLETAAPGRSSQDES